MNRIKNIAGIITSVVILAVTFNVSLLTENIYADQVGCGGIVYRQGNCENGIEIIGFPCYSDFCGNVPSGAMCLIELCQ